MDILALPRMVALLNKKWATYVREVFLLRMLFNLIWLSAFYCFAFYRSQLPPDRHVFSCPAGADVDTCRNAFICEVAVLVGALIKGLATIYRLWKYRNEVLVRSRSRYGGPAGVESFIKVISWVLTLIAFGVDARHGADASASVYAAASLMGFCLLVWFLLGWQQTGKYVIAIQRMLAGDLSKFVCVLLCVYFGFTQAFMLISGNDLGLSGVPLAKKIFRSFGLWLIQPDTFDEQYDDTLLFLTLVFDYFSTTVLMLLLTAQFTDTYSRIMEVSDKEWHLERAKIIIGIEQDAPDWLRRLPRYKYWAEIGSRAWLQDRERDVASVMSEARMDSVVNARTAAEQLPPER